MRIYNPLKKIIFPTAVTLATLFAIKTTPLQGECLCKVDVGPAYVHIDVLESKQTVEKLDIPAIRGDVSLVIGRGWCIKPTVLYAKNREGKLETFGIGFGRCLPIMERVILTPQVGVTYTSLATSIHLDLPQSGVTKFHERIRAVAPYAGVEVILKIAESWRLCANAQYAWSHSKTDIRKLLHTKDNSQGPNYGVLLEYDINCDWSVNIGAAYNESLSKEDNGLRGRGAKIGIARWF